VLIERCSKGRFCKYAVEAKNLFFPQDDTTPTTTTAEESSEGDLSTEVIKKIFSSTSGLGGKKLFCCLKIETVFLFAGTKQCS
jgi:hypothetical protein